MGERGASAGRSDQTGRVLGSQSVTLPTTDVMNPTLLTHLGQARADWLKDCPDAWHRYLACLPLVTAVSLEAGDGMANTEAPELRLAGATVHAGSREHVLAGDDHGLPALPELERDDAGLVGEGRPPTLVAPPEVAWVARTRHRPRTLAVLPSLSPSPALIEWHPHPDRVLGLAPAPGVAALSPAAPAPVRTKRRTSSSRSPLADWMKLARRRSMHNA